MTVAEAAEELGVTPLTVRRYIYRGLLPSRRTPGGHHRILREDIGALRIASGEERLGREVSPARDDPAPSQRLERLETEMEVIKDQLAVVASTFTRLRDLLDLPGSRSTEVPEHGPVFEVLGQGCRACDRLAALTGEAVTELDLRNVEVRRVRDPEQIAVYGPLLTPALVIGDTLVVSGRVPSREKLAELIGTCLN